MSNMQSGNEPLREPQKDPRPIVSAAPSAGNAEVLGAEMPSAIAGGAVYHSLPPEKQKVADELARTVDIVDPLQITDFGKRAQEQLVSVAKQVKQQAKAVEVQKLVESAQQLRETYEKLEIGKMRPSAAKGFLAAILGRRAESLQSFLSRQEELTITVDRLFSAQVDEEQGLREHYSAVQDLQEQNMRAYDDLSIQIAAAERALEAAYKATERLREEYEGTTDPQKIRELRLVLKGLDVLNHRVLTLKTARFEALNSSQIMDVQLEGLVSLIGMIRNSHTVMRQVWENQISLAVTTAKMAKGTTMLSENREFMNKMMSANLEDLAATAVAIQQEMRAGVVDISVLQAVASRTIALQEEIVAKSAAIQQSLQAQGKQVDSLVDAIHESAQSSAGVITSIDQSFAAKPEGE